MPFSAAIIFTLSKKVVATFAISGLLVLDGACLYAVGIRYFGESGGQVLGPRGFLFVEGRQARLLDGLDGDGLEDTVLFEGDAGAVHGADPALEPLLAVDGGGGLHAAEPAREAPEVVGLHQGALRARAADRDAGLLE